MFCNLLLNSSIVIVFSPFYNLVLFVDYIISRV
nr:MAG TPA: hypothetical protein [Caudoviricetes sp.]